MCLNIKFENMCAQMKQILVIFSHLKLLVVVKCNEWGIRLHDTGFESRTPPV